MINWQEIDTVLLDMDGTLLDLNFDDEFWQVRIPRAWGEKNGLDEATAKEELRPIFMYTEASLNWYCLDFWSRQLQLDVFQLAEEITDLVQLRPHVEAFLQFLEENNKNIVLVTNSHEKFIDLKMGLTGIDRYFHHMFNAHDFGHPKEDQEFWEVLGQRLDYDRQKSLLVDDNHTVLRSAKTFGIKHLLSIRQPNSRKPPRDITEFDAVDSYLDLVS